MNPHFTPNQTSSKGQITFPCSHFTHKMPDILGKCKRTSRLYGQSLHKQFHNSPPSPPPFPRLRLSSALDQSPTPWETVIVLSVKFIVKSEMKSHIDQLRRHQTSNQSDLSIDTHHLDTRLHPPDLVWTLIVTDCSMCGLQASTLSVKQTSSFDLRATEEPVKLQPSSLLHHINVSWEHFYLHHCIRACFHSGFF